MDAIFLHKFNEVYLEGLNAKVDNEIKVYNASLPPFPTNEAMGESFLFEEEVQTSIDTVSSPSPTISRN